jgi:ATP/maltotriose-dependent transcriptional regulator MalT
MHQNRLSEAEDLLRDAWDLSRAQLGAEHSDAGLTLSILAGAVQRQGHRLEESEELYREAVRILGNSLGDDHLLTLLAVNSLADVLSALGRHDDARLLVLQVREGVRKHAAPDHWYSLLPDITEAAIQARQGDFQAAEQVLRRCEDSLAVFGDDGAWAHLQVRECFELLDRCRQSPR